VPRRIVKNEDEFLAAAEEATAGMKPMKKPNWWESPDGRRRVEIEFQGHSNTNEGPHITMRDFDGQRHGASLKVFIDGWEKFRRSFWKEQ
jgi:hypothetical protein